MQSGGLTPCVVLPSSHAGGVTVAEMPKAAAKAVWNASAAARDDALLSSKRACAWCE